MAYRKIMIKAILAFVGIKALSLSTNFSKTWLWPAFTWCLGVAGMVGIWLSIALMRDAPCAWLAFLAALDIAFVLWLSGMPAGITRVMANILGVVVIIFASQWLIAATMFAGAWGIGHLEAAQEIGKVLAWEFTRLRLSQMDYWCFGIAIWLAAFLGAIGKATK
jgi:hypothetical protein